MALINQFFRPKGFQDLALMTLRGIFETVIFLNKRFNKIFKSVQNQLLRSQVMINIVSQTHDKA